MKAVLSFSNLPNSVAFPKEFTILVAVSAFLTERAFENSMNISKSPKIEVLLYFFGTRNISKALSLYSSLNIDDAVYVSFFEEEDVKMEDVMRPKDVIDSLEGLREEWFSRALLPLK